MLRSFLQKGKPTDTSEIYIVRSYTIDATGVAYNMVEKKDMLPKVLFLAGSYPNQENLISGIFVKRYALAASKYCNVAVLHVHMGSRQGITVSSEGDLVEVIVYRKLSKSRNNILRKPINAYHYTLGYLFSTLLGIRVAEERLGKADIVHVNTTYPAGIMALVTKLLTGTPYLISEHSSEYLKEDGTFGRRLPLTRWLMRRSAKGAECITAVSRKLRDSMTDCGMVNRFLIIPNVIDIKSRAMCHVSENRIKIILHVSLLQDNVKNVSGIIDAVRSLSEKRDDFELQIAGDGPDRAKLEEQAQIYGLLNHKVFFCGMVDPDEVFKLMEKCDFFVLNSNFETFSVSTAEALICGKPVIVTKCGGPEEFVDETCGILIEPKNKATLLNAIEYMLDMSRSYPCQQIQRSFQKRFSSESIGSQFNDIYRDILKDL
jgi:glycosyltransferase involved in cell wall biosynthesis